MYTTIQITSELRLLLEKLKLFQRETYNDVISRLVEDELELNKETKEEIETALMEVKAGKYITHAQAKKELGL